MTCRILLAVFLLYFAYVKYDAYAKKRIVSQFLAAWSSHDVAHVLSFMTETPTFFTALGKEARGNRWVGKEEVGRAILEIFERYPDGVWLEAEKTAVSGNRVAAPFLFRGTDRSGNRIEVNGVDLLTFRGHKIAAKDAYRKALLYRE